MALRRSARIHQTAGVDSEIYWEFRPGQKVMTVEGFLGTVDAVEDGPHPGSEQYLVTLDAGMGGGEYAGEELRAAPVTASLQVEADDDLLEMITCPACHGLGKSRSGWLQIERTCAECHGEGWRSITIEEWMARNHREPVAASKTASTEHVCGNCGRVYKGDPLCPHCLTADFEQPYTAAVQAGELHVAYEDYPELSEILVERPPLEHATPVNPPQRRRYFASRENEISAEAGVGDFLIDKTVDYYNRKNNWKPGDPGQMWSYDWCRFRRQSHCWFPKEMDHEATAEAGYAVWQPIDRGICPRGTWDEQKACPVAEPGPKSGENPSYVDATIPWDEGGQRGGVPMRSAALQAESAYVDKSTGAVYKDTRSYGAYLVEKGIITDAELRAFIGRGKEGANEISRLAHAHLYEAWARGEVEIQTGGEHAFQPKPYNTSDQEVTDFLMSTMTSLAHQDPEFGFHLTAAWKDVKEKAKRIRSEGGVRIIAGGSSPYIAAEVLGDTAIYETRIHRTVGGKSVAMWECGCNWSSYSWGRTGQWKRYEGRMCSHALALVYEAQAQEMFGGQITEQSGKPYWRKDPTEQVKQPTNYPKPKKRSSLVEARRPQVDPNTPEHLRPILIEDVAQWMMDEVQDVEPRITRDFKDVADDEMGEMEGLAFRIKSLDSLTRKLTDKARVKGLDALNDPFGRQSGKGLITDALRYTMAFSEVAWGLQVQDALFRLQDKGYRIIEEENSWRPGDSYSGLHYILVSRENIPIELQFHTSRSFNLKEKVLHKLYEEFRKPGVSLKRRQELWDLMTPYWDDIPIPANAQDFPVDISEKFKRPVAHRANLAADLHAPVLPKEALRPGSLKAKVRGMVRTILSLLPDGMVNVEGIGAVPSREVLYPTFDPSLGLDLRDSYASLKTAADEADVEGVMIAFVPPPHIIDAYVVDGGEDADNMHITLAYLGKTNEVGVSEEELVEIVEAYAYSQNAIVGEVSGYGTFLAGETPVLYASIDAPGLNEFRAGLVQWLATCGANVRHDHGYTPHMTIAYGEDDAPQTLPDEGKGRFTFPNVFVSWGENWYEIPLNAPGVTSKKKVIKREKRQVKYPYDKPAYDRSRWNRNWIPLPLAGAIVDMETGLSGAYDQSLPLEGSPEAAAGVMSIEPTAAMDEMAFEAMSLEEAAALVGTDTEVKVGPASPESHSQVWRGNTTVEKIVGDKVMVKGPSGATPIVNPEQIEINAAVSEYPAVMGGFYEEYDEMAFEGAWEDPYEGRNPFPMPSDDCTACEGTGEQGNGHECYICDGTGDGVEERLNRARGVTNDNPENDLPHGIDKGADLHDPEDAALPTTTGEEDEDEREIITHDHYVDEHPESQVTGSLTGPAWLAPGNEASPAQAQADNAEIAMMARRFLKEGMKTFTPAEQAQIIAEGADDDTRASNLDRLDIAGTHYELLEAALVERDSEGDDEDWMFN